MEKLPLSIFLSCSQRDESWRERLETHLSSLEREGRIVNWHAHKIPAGESRAGQVCDHLESADMILVLISADFIASEYGSKIEIERALKRHAAGDARVVPVHLRPCDWQGSPFAHLQALPRNGLAVTSWEDPEAALAEVALEIRRLVEEHRSSPAGAVSPEPKYLSERSRELSKALDIAYRRLEERHISGEDARAVEREILDLRRRLREDLLQPGDFLAEGRLRLIDMIGEGGLATVWKAWDRERRSMVAVKVLHDQYSRDTSRRARFFRGARKMAELQHQGIVRVIEEKGTDGRFHFFVMERIDGRDLRETVLEGRFSHDELLRVVLEAGEALAFAHERGVIHRDVKPANILIDGAGRARLADFDLVRAQDTTGGTRTGMLGTVVYAAPEMMGAAKEAGRAADVYGLAMTAVFALYGAELPLDVLRDAPGFAARLDTDPAVREILAKAVAWEAEQRFDSVESFCEALKARRMRSPAASEIKDHNRPTTVSGDDLIRSCGLVYDINDFSAVLVALGRVDKSRHDEALSAIQKLQRKFHQLGDSLDVRLEKYLGDGAFYTGYDPHAVIAVAMYLQRLYIQALEDGNPFDQGIRIAINYSEFRRLPLSSGPDEESMSYEYFGAGLLELSRLLSNSRTPIEIEKFKTYLVSQGYPEKTVKKFFEPMMRKRADLVERTEKTRSFFAYINANGTLINEGIVTTKPFLERLSDLKDLYYGKAGNRGYVVTNLVGYQQENLVVGIRKLGTARFESLEPTPVFEIIDGSAWQSCDALQKVSTRHLVPAIETLYEASR